MRVDGRHALSRTLPFSSLPPRAMHERTYWPKYAKKLWHITEMLQSTCEPILMEMGGVVLLENGQHTADEGRSIQQILLSYVALGVPSQQTRPNRTARHEAVNTFLIGKARKLHA